LPFFIVLLSPNPRVKENYDKNLPRSDIVSPLELVGSNHWKGCSTDLAQFGMFLRQLAKVALSKNDMIQMSASSPKLAWGEKRLSPNPFNVFIYTPEQLSDKNTTRQEKFRQDLQEFLRLDAPLHNFDDTPKVNANTATYPEYIDICDPKFTRIRNVLLNTGKRSSGWIIEHFIKAKDVVLSDEEFFIENLKTWGIDPCRSRQAESDSHKEQTLMNEEKNTVNSEKKLVEKNEMGPDSSFVGPKLQVSRLKKKNLANEPVSRHVNYWMNARKKLSENGASTGKEKKRIFVQ